MQVLLFCDKISLLSTQFLGSDKERKIFKKIFNFLKPFHLKTVLISENDKKAQLGKEKDMKKNWIKKVLAVAISACTLISTIGFDGTVVKAATYTTVSVDKEFVGKISELPEGGASKSYYSFTTDSTDSYYSVNLKAYNDSETGSVEYKIYDDEERAGDVVSEGSVGCNNYHEFDVAKGFKPNTKYYIEFTGSYVDKEPAKFKCTIKKYSTDDYKDDSTALKKFSVGATQTGIMNHGDDKDYFTFTTDETDSFYYMDLKAVCLMAGEGGNARVQIYSDKEFTNEIEDVDVDSGTSRKCDLEKKLKPNTQYYVMVTAGWLEKIGEKLRYEIKITKTVDDVKDTADKAKTLTLNKSYSQKIENDSDVDIFKVKTANFTDYKIVLKSTSTKGSIQLSIYSDKDLTNRVSSVYLSGKSAINAYSASIKLTPYKTYYFKVNGAADSKYTIGLNAKAPSNSAKSQLIKKKKCVTISWSRINKATGYEVFRATKNGKYKRIAVIKSAKTVKWIDKNVKKGTTYKYKVRAYAKVKGKTYYSAFSAEKSVKVK